MESSQGVLGTIAEIWRYPVKSMTGEMLDHCRVGPGGLVGDRGWAMRDERAGEIRGAKHLPKLLMCAARYLEEPNDQTIQDVEITLPDGSVFRTDDADVHIKLSEFLERRVTLWPLQPASNEAHYRRSSPLSTEAELREYLSRQSDERSPDLSMLDATIMQELAEFVSPRGTYFDVGTFHLLTSASIEALTALVPEARLDVRRFRPNLLIETPPGVEGFVEFDWTGSVLNVGGVRMIGGAPVPRCGMTAAAQTDLPKDPSILRTIVRKVNQNLGIYGSTDTSGTIHVGDTVEPAPSPI